MIPNILNQIDRLLLQHQPNPSWCQLLQLYVDTSLSLGVNFGISPCVFFLCCFYNITAACSTRLYFTLLSLCSCKLASFIERKWHCDTKFRTLLVTHTQLTARHCFQQINGDDDYEEEMMLMMVVITGGGNWTVESASGRGN